MLAFLTVRRLAPKVGRKPPGLAMTVLVLRSEGC
jgi:hypothetical protein